MTDRAGAQTDYTYDALGKPTKVAYPSGTPLDSTSGLYDLKARMYDAGTGRFASEDPVKGFATMPETLNPYVYGYDNPLAYPDPNGDCPICLAGAVYLLKNAAQSATFSAGEYYLTHRADKGGIDWVDFTRTVGYDAVTGSINPLGGAGKAGRIMKFADEARDAGRVADDIWIGSKIQRQMGKRGWTDTEVEDTITNPARTISTRDTRHLPGGGRMDDPATAYYRSDGSYVVRNNKTGDIVQVSNEPNPVAPACREGGGDGRNGRSRTGAQIDGAPRPCVPQGFICI